MHLASAGRTCTQGVINFKFKVGSDIDIEFWVVSKKKAVPRTINYMVSE